MMTTYTMEDYHATPRELRERLREWLDEQNIDDCRELRVRDEDGTVEATCLKLDATGGRYIEHGQVATETRTVKVSAPPPFLAWRRGWRRDAAVVSES